MLYKTVAICALAIATITPNDFFPLTDVNAHAVMSDPVPKQPDAIYWFQVGCYLGCECAGYGKSSYPTPEDHECKNPKEPTNNAPEGRTFNALNKSPAGDWNKYFPWRGPGFAIPQDSCGLSAGFTNGANAYGSKVSAGYKQGDKGTAVLPKTEDKSKNNAKNYWVSGKTAEVAFAILVNHGGGYQYRLCPKSSKTTDEKCFEANVLDFTNKKHEIRFNDKSRKSVMIDATDVTVGVNPAGKAWRRIPVPACACDSGSGCYGTADYAGKGNFTTPYESNADQQKSFTDMEKKTKETLLYNGICGENDEMKKAPLQFYPQYMIDGTWPDGYGYYMKGRRYKSDATNSKTADVCRKYDGKKSDCLGDTICDVYVYDGKDLCFTKEYIKSMDTKSTGDACRKMDGDKDNCVKDTNCEVLTKDQDYCVSKKITGAKTVLRNLMSHLASEKTTTKTTTVTSYFGAEYTPSEEDFEVVDTVNVPKVEVETEYTLSWRWDCEQTPQVWTTCADLTIMPDEDSYKKKVCELDESRCDNSSAYIGKGGLSSLVMLVVSWVLFAMVG